MKIQLLIASDDDDYREQLSQVLTERYSTRLKSAFVPRLPGWLSSSAAVFSMRRCWNRNWQNMYSFPKSACRFCSGMEAPDARYRNMYGKSANISGFPQW